MLAEAKAASTAAQADAASEVDATLARTDKQGKQVSNCQEESQQQQQQQQLAAEISTLGAGGVVAVEEVVAAAVGSMPARAASRGVSTIQQLSARCVEGASKMWVRMFCTIDCISRAELAATAAAVILKMDQHHARHTKLVCAALIFNL